ncbi:hypothetical protein AAIB41_11445 [Brucella sp. BE17]|uniref:hypothetical protein n=1 Tax=Brucella sp. BE17 TaxID=3142977 RepID=UPI0031BBBB4D
MISNSFVRSEASFLYHSASLCREAKEGSDGAWQIAPYMCSIDYTPDCLEVLAELKQMLAEKFPVLSHFGERRADRAYGSNSGSITKPNYVSRIKKFPINEVNQHNEILETARREPSSGGLVFSIFNPSDLVEKKRPGFVPCLIAGSFLVHEGQLQLNAFFRSQSVVEFGLFDLEFLRRFQIDTAERINNHSRKKIAVGSLNIQFGRIIIQRRLARNSNGFIRRQDIIDDWISNLYEFCLKHD